MDHGVVQRWLRQVLIPYADPDRVYADVDRTLLAVSSLAPKTEVYTYDDGRTQLLLVLTGTIPINFRSATYNIPMALWVPRPYPREPPLAYVTPTNDMLVRKGKHVDLSGRVGGAYLEQWQRKWEACSLLELVHDCQAMFSQEPPVYAKPKNAGTASQRQATPTSPVPPASAQGFQGPPQLSTSLVVDPRERTPIVLPEQQQSAAQAQQSALTKEGAPLRPPKPGQSFSQTDGPDRRFSNGSAYMSPVSPQQRWSQVDSSSEAHRSPVEGGHRYSAEPGQLHGYGAPTTSAPSRGPGQAQASSGSAHRYTSWNGPSPALPVNGPPLQSTGGYRSPSYSSIGSSDGAGSRPVPPPLPPAPQHHGPTQIPQDPYATSRSGPEPPVSAPPRPPNPELLHIHALLHSKIQARLHHFQSTTEESNAQLRLLSDDLDRGELAIKDEIARLEAVRDVCRATGDQLQQSVDAGVRRVEELRAREEPDVDGLLSATSLVGNQYVDHMHARAVAY